jgi:hypothetical protein
MDSGRPGEQLLASSMVLATNLVLESVICWADPRIAAIPVHPSVASTAHERVLKKLARLRYRRRLAKRALDLATFEDDL